MAQLSVIVPVYNVERYLSACLDSLCAQSLHDIEIICINDGSTDGSAALLSSYAKNDARIRVVSKANGGLSSARNAGLAVATAPFVCFVDSDDWLLSSACERMVEVLSVSQADVLTFGAAAVSPDEVPIWLRDALSPRTVYYPTFTTDLLFKEHSHPFAWRSACRRDFLERWNLHFDEHLRYGEDQAFHFALYPRAHGVQLLEDKLYCYRIARSGSLMGRFANDPLGLQLSHVAIVDAVYADWDSLGILRQYAREMVSWTVEFILFNALRLSGKSAAQVCQALAAVLLAYWSLEELHTFSLMRSDRRIIDAALSGRILSSHQRMSLRSASFFERYGARAWLAWALRGFD